MENCHITKGDKLSALMSSLFLLYQLLLGGVTYCHWVISTWNNAPMVDQHSFSNNLWTREWKIPLTELCNDIIVSGYSILNFPSKKHNHTPKFNSLVSPYFDHV